MLNVGGTDNHVHVLFLLPKSQLIPQAVQRIKGSSSYWINDTGRSKAHGRFRYQSGYGIFSIGQSQAVDLIDYIDRQEEHHATETYEQEIKRLHASHEAINQLAKELASQNSNVPLGTTQISHGL